MTKVIIFLAIICFIHACTNHAHARANVGDSYSELSSTGFCPHTHREKLHVNSNKLML